MTSAPWWRVAFVGASGRVSWLSGHQWGWSSYPENARVFQTEREAAQAAGRWVAYRAARALPAQPLTPDEEARLFVAPFQGLADDGRRRGWRPWREVLAG